MDRELESEQYAAESSNADHSESGMTRRNMVQLIAGGGIVGSIGIIGAHSFSSDQAPSGQRGGELEAIPNFNDIASVSVTDEIKIEEIVLEWSELDAATPIEFTVSSVQNNSSESGIKEDAHASFTPATASSDGKVGITVPDDLDEQEPLSVEPDPSAINDGVMQLTFTATHESADTDYAVKTPVTFVSESDETGTPNPTPMTPPEVKLEFVYRPNHFGGELIVTHRRGRALTQKNIGSLQLYTNGTPVPHTDLRVLEKTSFVGDLVHGEFEVPDGKRITDNDDIVTWTGGEHMNRGKVVKVVWNSDVGNKQAVLGEFEIPVDADGV